jgi:hypothetical protein
MGKLIHIFPFLQLMLCLASSIIYIVNKDIKNALYWFLAGSITYVVTWMK